MKRTRLSRGSSKARPVRMMRAPTYKEALERTVMDMRAMEMNIFQLSSVLARLYGKDKNEVFMDIANKFKEKKAVME